MNTEFKVRNIKTIGDILIAAETLVKIIGGDLSVKLEVPLDIIYYGKTKRIDLAEVSDKSLIGQSPVRGDMQLPHSPDRSREMLSALMSHAMRPAPIGDDQDHIGE